MQNAQPKPHISIVVAIDKNRAIGHGNELLWHIPEDLKRFKALTLGHPIIMGRKTFESIIAYLKKPLPGRQNIVVTRDTNYTYEGVIVCHSLEEALEKAKELDQEEIHIGGGAQMYEAALPYVDRLYLTIVDAEKPADTYFPDYTKDFTKKTFEEGREYEGIKYKWVNLERN